jgi:hypothetical protein
MMERMAEIILAEESYQIIRACVEVYDEMGSGFLEPIRAIRVIRGFFGGFFSNSLGSRRQPALSFGPRKNDKKLWV